MKIVYCIAKTHGSGGMERVLANKANWLARHGHEVTIVTTDQMGLPPFFALDPSIKTFDLGINYEENNGKGFLDKLLHYPGKQLRHRRQLSKLLKELRPDVTVSMFCNDASMVHSMTDGSAKVLEIHFSRFKRLQYGRRGLWRLADRLRSRGDAATAAKYDKFVVLTREDRGYWGPMDNITVIPNAYVGEIGAEYDVESKRVIAVGRLDYQKGFERLVEAWRIVADHNPSWTLHIYGDGEEKQSLLQQIKTLRLEENIKLHEPTKDIMARYRESAFLVMSSRYEGLPMALVEAQACALPIVAFDCKCGPGDIVTPEVDGLLVPEGDVEKLAAAINRLIANPSLREKMSGNAQRAVKRYDEDTIMKQWIDVFNQVTARNK